MKAIINEPLHMKDLAKKWGWFVGLWFAGVICVTLVATVIRWAIL